MCSVYGGYSQQHTREEAGDGGSLLEVLKTQYKFDFLAFYCALFSLWFTSDSVMSPDILEDVPGWKLS